MMRIAHRRHHFANVRGLSRGLSAGMSVKAIVGQEQTAIAARNASGAMDVSERNKTNFAGRKDENEYGVVGCTGEYTPVMWTQEKRKAARLDAGKEMDTWWD